MDQEWLLPPSVHDFVPAGHPAHLVRELVRTELDLSAILAAYQWEERGQTRITSKRWRRAVSGATWRRAMPTTPIPTAQLSPAPPSPPRPHYPDRLLGTS